MNSRLVELQSGVHLNVTCRGQGRPLLLVHGFPLDHTMWEEQLASLSDHCLVIAPDLPGFGKSSPILGTYTMAQFADDLREMLDRIGVSGQVVYCGLSMGGYIGWQFWQRHRDRLAALIQCDTRAAADTDEVRQGRHYLAERVEREGSAVATGEMTAKLLSDFTRQQRMIHVHQLRNQMASVPPVSLAAASRGMAERPSMLASLPEISLPTLLICGQYDVITTPLEMRQMAAAIPGAQYVEIADAGHLSPWEQPLVVNAHIERFLAQLADHTS